MTAKAVRRINIIRSKKFWAGILLAQFLLFYILSKIPAAVSLFENIFQWQKNIHLQIFAGLPISAGDIFYIILCLLLIGMIVQLFRRRYRSSAILSILILFNILYFTYQVFWGMLYFQQPLYEKLSGREPTPADAKALARIYLQKCIESRSETQEDEHGVFMVKDREAIKQEILRNQRKIPVAFSTKTVAKYQSIKPSLFRKIMNYTGISGYYNPFTAEAQYNSAMPHSYIPATIAHETAHQLGFAREQEASFIGFLLAENSGNAELRYSTEYFVLKSLLRSLAENDSGFVDEIIAGFSEPMKKDLASERKFSEEHDGLLNTFFGITNNLFLKSNQQEGSITYSYFVDLLIRYEKAKKRIAFHNAIPKTQMMKKNIL